MNQPIDRVHIEAFDAEGITVLSRVVAFLEYYEGRHALTDSEEFRQARGIVKVKGVVYGADGVEQEFETDYAPSGEVLRNRARFKDGTTTDVDLTK